MQIVVGKGITLDVNPGELPGDIENENTALGHVIKIGLRNILMDVHAGETDAGAAEHKAREKLAALMAGTVRIAGTREGDPVRAMAMQLATKVVKAGLRKAGKALKDYDAKAIRAKAAELVAHETHGPKLMAKAKELVEASKDLDVDVDME